MFADTPPNLRPKVFVSSTYPHPYSFSARFSTPQQRLEVTGTHVVSVRKVACFSIFLNSEIFVLWTFSLLKMTIFILLTSILLLPMPLKTLAEHKKSSQLVITGIDWIFQVPVYSSKLSKVHFTSMYSKMCQNFVLSVRRILLCELRSLNHFHHTACCCRTNVVSTRYSHIVIPRYWTRSSPGVPCTRWWCTPPMNSTAPSPSTSCTGTRRRVSGDRSLKHGRPLAQGGPVCVSCHKGVTAVCGVLRVLCVSSVVGYCAVLWHWPVQLPAQINVQGVHD